MVIAGGSGFLGQKLAQRLTADGHRVLTLTRRAKSEAGSLSWRPDGTPGDLPQHLAGVDAIVNLAGEGIADRRWTAARKEALRRSRILSTRTLVAAMAACPRPVKVLVSASGVGFYGARGDEPLTESAPPGSDFLAGLCVEWENEARAASPGTRLAIVRTGLALAKDGGALKKMLMPFMLGLGATLGSGDQVWSWIHVDDWTALVAWLIQNDRATGAFNATAPAPVTNRTFTRTLARVLHRPALLHAPGFALTMAMGEMAQMLLTGQRAVPAAAEQMGFRFTYRALEPALESLEF